MLDFTSEAFIWVGKKATDKDRLYVFVLAYQALTVLHQSAVEKMSIGVVESGFEPEVFKSAFIEGWQQFDHVESGNGQSIMESDEEDSSEEEDDKKKENREESNVEILPEAFWSH